MVQIDARGKQVKPAPAGNYRQATPHEKGAAVEMYFDGLSYRKTAGNMDQFFWAGNHRPQRLRVG